MLNHAAPNYKNSRPLIITLQISRSQARTLEKASKNGDWSGGYFRGTWPRKIGVIEMTIVNWEKGRTKPVKKNLEGLQKLLKIEQ